MRNGSSFALLQTGLAAALWGTSFPVVTIGIRGGLEPLVFFALRFAIAAPLMLGMARALGKRTGALFRSRGIWIVGGFNALGFLCQFIGQQHTGASVAALLTNVSVVLAAVGAAVFLNEKLGGLKVAGVLLAFAGTALLTTGGDIGSIASSEAFGDVLYLVAAASWAGYIVYSKRRMEEEGWDPLAAAACIVTVTAILAVPVAVLSPPRFSPTSVSVAAVVFTALFNTVIPFVLYQQGLRRLSASTSAVVLMLEIIVAVAISVAFLGETMTPVAWAGALAVLGSVVLVSGIEVGRPRPRLADQ